eukprot:m.934083 g.934083  ORF g.934083 m.934083 type:complete len:454 (-) comp23797_c0_seq2:1503-2864(-)
MLSRMHTCIALLLFLLVGGLTFDWRSARQPVSRSVFFPRVNSEVAEYDPRTSTASPETDVSSVGHEEWVEVPARVETAPPTWVSSTNRIPATILNNFPEAKTVESVPVSTQSGELKTADKASDVPGCNANSPVVVRTGAWSRAGQRLGNTICMLGKALTVAEDVGGGNLELLAPGNRFYNTTRFCTEAAADVGGTRAAATTRALPIEENFNCYTPCTCASGHFFRFRHVLQQYVLPNFMVRPRRDMGDDAVVIHIRSGDVMRNTRGVKYWQPPLKFYKYIIETFHQSSNNIYMCTEEHGAADGVVGGNPVVHELLQWRPDIIFPPSDFHRDVATLLGAAYLIQAVSSFSTTLAIMSPHLRRTYIPRPVSLRDNVPTAKGCCDCDRSGADGRSLPKEWNCGADRGWPQTQGDTVEMVQILLPGFQAGDQNNFTEKRERLLAYDGPVCHNAFPKR